MSKRRLKKKYRISLLLVFTFICLFGLIYSLINIINWKKDVAINSKTQKSIEKYIEIDEQDEIEINFDELRKINSDTVGYLEVPNTNIKYVTIFTDRNIHINLLIENH